MFSYCAITAGSPSNTVYFIGYALAQTKLSPDADALIIPSGSALGRFKPSGNSLSLGQPRLQSIVPNAKSSV